MPDPLLLPIPATAILQLAARSFADATTTGSGMPPTSTAVADCPAALELAVSVVAMILPLGRQT